MTNAQLLPKKVLVSLDQCRFFISAQKNCKRYLERVVLKYWIKLLWLEKTILGVSGKAVTYHPLIPLSSIMKQLKRNILALFSILVLFCASFTNAQESMHVVFINPDPPDSPFWSNMTSFMQAVANNLDIQLDVLYGDRTRFKNEKNFLQVLNQTKKPDYIITILQESMAPKVLSAAESSGVKVFVVNTDIPLKVQGKIGTPREKYTSWIGHMFPDDEQGGYLLAQTLAKLTTSLSTEIKPPFEMFGISGSHDSSPALLRNNGVKKALIKEPEILLNQIIYAQWDEQKAYEIASGLFLRYPNTSLVFCAGGAMTSGTLKAIQDSSRTPGKDLLFGSFDWNEAIVNHIKDGTMAASVGGHFMDGGWSLILLYDYHHGIDFEDSVGITIRKPLSVMTRANVNEYEALLNKESWENINFKKLTKTLGKKDTPYTLTIDALIQ